MAIAINIQSDVIYAVVFRLQLPTPAAGQFVTDADMLLLAKSSVSRLSALLIRLFSDDYFLLTSTLTTQAGIDIVSLPANFATLRSVWWVSADNKSHPLTRADISDYDPTAVAWESGSDLYWTGARLPRYRIEANVLVLTPIPNAVYNLRVSYTTGLFITALSDTIFGQIGWAEWLICDICQRIREREQKPADEFIRDRMEAEVNIQSQAANRDRFSACQVRDTRGSGNSSLGGRWRRWGR